jgi:hypothetical protein
MAGTVKAMNYRQWEKMFWWNTTDINSRLIVTASETGEILPTATSCPEKSTF